MRDAYTIAEAAERDLLSILGRISTDNATAAARMKDRFFQTFELLAHSPKMGRTFRLGLRRINEGDDAILCRESSDGVEIARVVHGMQNLDAFFRE